MIKKICFYTEEIYLNLMYIFLIIYSIYSINNKPIFIHEDIGNYIVWFSLIEISILISLVKKIINKTILKIENKCFEVWIITLIWNFLAILISIHGLNSVILIYERLIDIRNNMSQNPTYWEYHSYIVSKNYFVILIIVFSIHFILLIVNRLIKAHKFWFWVKG